MVTSTRTSSVMQKVRKQVDGLPPGQLITYADLDWALTSLRRWQLP